MKTSHAPMGWNSYDYYDTTVTEEQVKKNADYMAAHLKEFGWEYVVVDIQWYAWATGSMRDRYQYIPFGKVEMDEYGRLLPCPEKFPSAKDGKGFAPLADYVHALGLKFGIHIMRGIPREAAHNHLPVLGSSALASDIADPSSICKWNPDMYGLRADMPGSQAYYDSLIELYASWGVDFIKCDDICNTNLYVENPYSAAHEIEMLHRAIEKSGREIVLSLSPGPALIEKAWHYEKYANMWRITDDFWDDWNLLKGMFDRCELWQKHVGSGSYPDCDMLPVGKLGKGFGFERDTNFTKEEQRTMMTLWCLFGSPLMIGAELTLLDPWTLSLLTNREILSLLSDVCERQQEERTPEYIIWSSRNKSTADRYLAFFNISDEPQEITYKLPAERTEATELWTGEKMSIAAGAIHTVVAPLDVKIYKENYLVTE
jgi:hypothetical protein